MVEKRGLRGIAILFLFLIFIVGVSASSQGYLFYTPLSLADFGAKTIFLNSQSPTNLNNVIHLNSPSSSSPSSNVQKRDVISIGQETQITKTTNSFSTNIVGNPDTECQDNGFDIGIVKYSCDETTPDDTGSAYSDYSIEVDWADCEAVDWTSNPAVAGVLTKEGTNTYIHDGGLFGAIDKSGQYDISHVTFCGNREECEDCLIPDSLNDTTSETIKMNGEKNLQTLLKNRGYIINVTKEQTNIQVWHVEEDTEIELRYIGRIASFPHVFGYYLNGNINTFTPVFEDNSGGNHPDYNLPIASINQTFIINIPAGSNLGFAIDTYSPPGFSQANIHTENNFNYQLKDHAIVFDLCGEYILGFEDTYRDWDYQDMVVVVRGLSCEPEPICGDGVINQISEQCDDGNLVNGDGCSESCSIEECTQDSDCGESSWEIICLGNWRINETTIPRCINGDCTVDMTQDEVELCELGCSYGECNEPVCRNGVVEDGEQCDDGNNVDDDQCSNSCTINPYCGDGFLNQEWEECDDGNLVNGDGCDAECFFEGCRENSDCGTDFSSGNYCLGEDVAVNHTFFLCNNPGTVNAYCSNYTTTNTTNACEYGCSNGQCEEPYCGDGSVDNGEECDFGLNNGNVCTPDYNDFCVYCTDICEYDKVKGPECGDGQVDSPYEQCDDGNLVNGDGCDNSCNIEVCIPETCDSLDKVCGEWDDSCGGVLNCGPEVINCSDEFGTCVVNGTKSCLVNGTGYGLCDAEDPRSNNCEGLECGSDLCGGSCGECPYGESCDIGICILDPYCGDGNLDEGEFCDDGNNLDFDGCNSQCYPEFCNDGIIQPGEECDDGEFNTLNGCTLNVSSYCEYQTCKVIECGPVCGNGVVEEDEQCDDGNLVNGDGCSNICEVEEVCDYECLEPNSLNDTTHEIIKTNLEKNLGQLLSEAGYNINVTSDQTNIQVWETNQNVVLQLKYLGRISSYPHVFGYYLDSNISTFVPLFEDNTLNSHPLYNLTIAHVNDTFNITVPAGHDIGFAIHTYAAGHPYGNPSIFYYTENSLNPLGKDQAVVFDECDEFVVAFDDTFGDRDYQDVVVAVKRLSCGQEFICRNGVVEDGEQCDDGNNVDDDQCSNSCTINPYCGDGFLNQEWEECDDGNLVNGDGCDAECFAEFCGDGKLQEGLGEVCDSGDLNGNVCTPEYNDYCIYCSDECEYIKLEVFCGDGILQEEFEQCDDGNIVNGDGCSNQCTVEDICIHDVGIDYDYSDSVGTGIRIREQGEDWILNDPAEIDSGKVHEVRFGILNNIPNSTNNINVLVKINNTVITNYNRSINIEHYNSTFFNSSQFVPGSYLITLDVSKINETDCNLTDNHAERWIIILEEEPYCGDGTVDAGEVCDLGLGNGQVCVPEYGGECVYCTDICEYDKVKGPECGDGVLQEEFEQCDDGNIVNGDGCDNSCMTEVCIPETCDSLDKVCGEWDDSCGGVLNCGPEVINCSDEFGTCVVNGTKSCLVNGTGYGLCDAEDPREPEICDELDNDCDGQVDEYLQCEEPYCGDGSVDNGEECDSGDLNGNVCTPDYNDFCVYCTDICEYDKVKGPECGDGQVDSPYEQCDDGNTNNNDLCDNTCRFTETCEDRDSDNDGVNDCDDICPDSKPGEPVDEDGCDIFQFCTPKFCGFDCQSADWMHNEEGSDPKDCKVVIVSREGQLYPACVPTVFSNVCAG